MPCDTPPAVLAAIELIDLAIDTGNPALAMAIFESYEADERERIAELIRHKLRRELRIGRSRRV